MLMRMPSAETSTTKPVTSRSTSSSGRTKRSRSWRISATGSAACASPPSLIAVLNPIAVSSGGSPGSEAVSRRIAVTSRCAAESGAGPSPAKA